MAHTPSSARPRATEPEPTDRRVLENAQAEGTLEALLRQGYRFALSLTHDPARAEDLLQDAWVAILKADGPRTAAYLITAIRTRFIDQHRRALIAPTESLDAKPHLAATVESELWSDPCHSIAMGTTLHRAMSLLRPVERAVMLLSAVEGYTAREIGELLGAPRGTVLSLMHRTRAKMQRWLKEHSDPEER